MCLSIVISSRLALSICLLQSSCQKLTDNNNNNSKQTKTKPDCNQSCVVLRNQPFCLNVFLIVFQHRAGRVFVVLSLSLPLFLTVCCISFFRSVVKEKIHVQPTKFQIRTDQSVNQKIPKYVNVVDVLYFFVFPFVVLFYTN